MKPMHRLSSALSALVLVALSQTAWAVCGRTCASRPEGCDEGFGTLAYVVTTCRVVGTNQIGAQELRVERSGCDPITVLRLTNPEPVVDPFGLCTILGRNHLGVVSPLAGVFQRLGVTPEGAGVVFEVTNAFQLPLVGQTPLAPEQQGFFYVRADGTGLRRLGPASRDRSYRIYQAPGGVGAEAKTRIAFSADGRRLAFTDLAAGPDGVETEQIFAMELETGERHQVTHLMGEVPSGSVREIESFNFDTPTTIIFVHRTGDDRQVLLIELDGTGLRPQIIRGLPLDGGSNVVQTVQRSGRHYSVFAASLPGPAVNGDVLVFAPHPLELFSHFANRYPIQLTNFGYGDTGGVGARRNAVLLMASADPFGTNPFHNCQFFRVSPLGLGLRQVTHFDDGRRSEEGCQYGALPGCGIIGVNEWRSVFETSSHAFPFYSDCDPFGTNPNGSQVFAMRWNGSGLRQLTHTRGTTTATDGSVVEVEIPGPVARGG